MVKRRVFLNYFLLFVPNAPFLYPLKTSENREDVQKGYIGNKWVNFSVVIFASDTYADFL